MRRRIEMFENCTPKMLTTIAWGAVGRGQFLWSLIIGEHGFNLIIKCPFNFPPHIMQFRHVHTPDLSPNGEKIPWTLIRSFWISNSKFSDAGIQDISTSISINVRMQKNFYDLTERCESDDESDKHLEARDRRYSCLIFREIIILWSN